MSQRKSESPDDLTQRIAISSFEDSGADDFDSNIYTASALRDNKEQCIGFLMIMSILETKAIVPIRGTW